MPPPFLPLPVVLVVRDPDFSNEIAYYNEAGQLERAVKIIDVDLGRMDLSDPEERNEWIQSQMHAIRDLPHGHPAKLEVLDQIDRITERYADA